MNVPGDLSLHRSCRGCVSDQWPDEITSGSFHIASEMLAPNSPGRTMWEVVDPESSNKPLDEYDPLAYVVDIIGDSLNLNVIRDEGISGFDITDRHSTCVELTGESAKRSPARPDGYHMCSTIELDEFRPRPLFVHVCGADCLPLFNWKQGFSRHKKTHVQACMNDLRTWIASVSKFGLKRRNLLRRLRKRLRSLAPGISFLTCIGVRPVSAHTLRDDILPSEEASASSTGWVSSLQVFRCASVLTSR